MGRAGWWGGGKGRAQGRKQIWRMCGLRELRFKQIALHGGSVGDMGAAIALHAAMRPRRAVQEPHPGCAAYLQVSDGRPAKTYHDRTVKPPCPQACKIEAVRCGGFACLCSRAMQGGCAGQAIPAQARLGQSRPWHLQAPQQALPLPITQVPMRRGAAGQGVVTLRSIRTWRI